MSKADHEKLILLMFCKDDLGVEDAILLQSLSISSGMHITYKHYSKFSLHGLTFDECLARFWF